MRLLLILIVSALTVFGLELKPNSRYVCYITKVLDGDTVKCRFPYPVSKEVKSYPVRLIGIDTPETGIWKKNTGKQEEELEKVALQSYHKYVNLSKKDVVDYGIEAKRFVENILKTVYVAIVETDVQPTDHYGRILGYIWLPDGEMLNKKIICSGYALLLTVPPNVKYAKEFRKCFRKAVEEKKGFWKELAGYRN